MCFVVPFYDEFNRLSSISTKSGHHALSYVYDRWGNRWQQNVTAGGGSSTQLSFNIGNNQHVQAGNGMRCALAEVKRRSGGRGSQRKGARAPS